MALLTIFLRRFFLRRLFLRRLFLRRLFRRLYWHFFTAFCFAIYSVQSSSTQYKGWNWGGGRGVCVKAILWTACCCQKQYFVVTKTRYLFESNRLVFGKQRIRWRQIWLQPIRTRFRIRSKVLPSWRQEGWKFFLKILTKKRICNVI